MDNGRQSMISDFCTGSLVRLQQLSRRQMMKSLLKQDIADNSRNCQTENDEVSFPEPTHSIITIERDFAYLPGNDILASNGSDDGRWGRWDGSRA